MLYYIFSKVQSIISKPFGLIVDLTLFGLENEWNIDTINLLEKIYPTEGKANLQYVIFLHANTFFKIQVKKVSRILSTRFFKHIIFAASVNELSEYVTLEHLVIPKMTMLVNESSSILFSQVTQFTTIHQPITITFSVSSGTFQLIHSKKQELLGNQVTLMDTYLISDILDLGVRSNNASRNVEHDFFIKIHQKQLPMSNNVKGGIIILTFTSPRRDSILQALRSAIARYALSRPAVVSEQRNLSPRDLPGTLLNIAFLNIGSDDAFLRVASYNLLCSIIASFGFAGGIYLNNAKGTFIYLHNFKCWY